MINSNFLVLLSLFFFSVVFISCTGSEESFEDGVSRQEDIKLLDPEEISTSPMSPEPQPLRVRRMPYTEVINEETAIISLAAPITELLCHMDYCGHIVGRDVLSSSPTNVIAKPNLGNAKTIRIADIKRFDPDIVFAFKEDLEDSKVKKLQNAGIEVKTYSMFPSLEDAQQLYKEVARDIGHPAIGDSISEMIQKQLAAIPQKDIRYELLFVYPQSPGNLYTAGRNTAVHAMMEFAHIENIIDREGYFHLDSLRLSDIQPDAILMFESSLAMLGGIEQLKEHRILKDIPAVKERRIIVMDAHYLSGFGMRMGYAAKQLHEMVYGEISL